MHDLNYLFTYWFILFMLWLARLSYCTYPLVLIWLPYLCHFSSLTAYPANPSLMRLFPICRFFRFTVETEFKKKLFKITRIFMTAIRQREKRCSEPPYKIWRIRLYWVCLLAYIKLENFFYINSYADKGLLFLRFIR